MGHAAHHRDVQARYVAELNGVIRFGIDGFGQILANFGDIDVNPHGEFNVPDMVATQVDMHNTGYTGILGSILVIFDPLDKRRGAIAYTNNRHTNFLFTHIFSYQNIFIISINWRSGLNVWEHDLPHCLQPATAY